MQTQNLVLEKYNTIKKSGIAAYENRAVTPFTVFPLETFKKRFNIAMLFDEGSERRITEEVIIPLSETISEVSMIRAGRNFPIHVTLLEGDAPAPIALYPDWFTKIASAMALAVDETICFDRLIADSRGCVLLLATNIPARIISLRAFIKSCYEIEGVKPLALDNILHSTQARITRLPPNQEALYDFLELVSGISSRLERSPVVARVGKISAGTAYDLLK